MQIRSYAYSPMIALVLTALPCNAAPTAIADLSQQFVYDSNPLRLAHGAEGIFGSTTSPSLTLTSETPRGSISAQTRVTNNLFNDSAYNSVDLFEDITLTRQNARWQTGLGASFAYDTVRSSEITNFAINAPDIRSEKFTLTPKVAFRPNATERTALSGSFTTTHYDQTAFTDYQLYTLNPRYEHAFSPADTGLFGLYAQRYEADANVTSTSTSVGPQIGLQTSLTPHLRSELSAGALATDKRYDADEQHLLNYVFRGALTYKGEQDTLDLLTRRAREPFGNGTETLLTSLTLDARHRLNPLLSLKAQGKAQTADYESAPGTNLDHGETIGGGVAYALTQHTELAADYRYRSEKLTTIANPIDQHLVMLSLTYHPVLKE